MKQLLLIESIFKVTKKEYEGHKYLDIKYIGVNGDIYNITAPVDMNVPDGCNCLITSYSFTYKKIRVVAAVKLDDNRYKGLKEIIPEYKKES